MKIALFLLTILLSIFISCKKDKNLSPTLEISSPIENTYITTTDTILIKGNVSDDEKVENISVKIVNSDLTAISKSFTININKKSYSFNFNYIPEFISEFTNNTYYLKISAFDGELYSNKFIKLGINNFHFFLKKYFVFISESNQSTALYEIDSLLNTNKINSFNDKIRIAKLGNNLITFNDITGIATLYNKTSFELIWNIYNVNNYISNYSSFLDCIDNYYFVSHANGKIIAYDDNKVIRKTFLLSDSSYVPYYFCKIKDKFLSFSNSTNNKKRIDINNYTTESNISYLNINFDAKYANFFNENEAIIIGNKNDSAYICILDLITYSLKNIMTYNYKILSACKLNNNIILYSTSKNEIKAIINYLPNIWTLVQNQNSEKMYFDEYNKLLFIKNQNKLNIYLQASESQLIKYKTIDFNYAIEEIVIQ